jgi:hypothetical protein
MGWLPGPSGNATKRPTGCTLVSEPIRPGETIARRSNEARSASRNRSST